MSSTTIDQLLASTPRRSTIRLTRRGRLVVLGFSLVVLFLVGLLGAGLSGASERPGRGAPTHLVVVAPGDTLWGFASAAAHGGSILDMEQRIKDLNGLDSAVLISGQRLRIPN